MLKDFDSLLEKVEKIKKDKTWDLSSDEDLSVAVMNLISIEEHLFFTAQKTGKKEYFDFLEKVREMRKEFLAKIVKKKEGEIWCISKHLLAASMRLIEVGTKELKKGNKVEAYNLFKKSFELYSLFWGINLDLVKSDDLQETLKQEEMEISGKGKVDLLGKIGNIVKKILNCCKE